MQVRAKEKCFIDNAVRNEGDVFEYNGPENGNVEPVNAPTPSPRSRPLGGQPVSPKPANSPFPGYPTGGMNAPPEPNAFD